METKNKAHPLTALAFLEVGLFEIVFVGVMLLLLFGTLNYFNILPVSATFPKYLSWLPRREIPTGVSKTTPQGQALQNTKESPTGASPTPTQQAAFQYDVAKAKTLLTQYLQDTIKPEILPDKIEIVQGQQIDGVKSNLPYEFGWYNQNNTASFGATLHFVENTATVDDKEIFMEINDSNEKESGLTANLANSLLNPYLKNKTQILQSSDCKTRLNTSSCQVFKQESDGKSGFGIIMLGKGAIPTLQSTHLILFSCFLPKEGNSYKTQQGCLKQF